MKQQENKTDNGKTTEKSRANNSKTSETIEQITARQQERDLKGRSRNKKTTIQPTPYHRTHVLKLVRQHQIVTVRKSK